VASASSEMWGASARRANGLAIEKAIIIDRFPGHGVRNRSI
jgi:hypothetical protein